MNGPQLPLWPDDPRRPPACGDVPGVAVAVVLSRRELERGMRDWFTVALHLADGREPSISRAWTDPEPRIVRRVLALVDGRPERLAGLPLRVTMGVRQNRDRKLVMQVADVARAGPADLAALAKAGVRVAGSFFDWRDGLPPDGDPRWWQLPKWLRGCLRGWWPEGSKKGAVLPAPFP